jgi:hypothetical protein
MGWDIEDTMRQERDRQRRYEYTLKANREAIDERLERLGILPRWRRLPRNPTVDDLRRAGLCRFHDS